MELHVPVLTPSKKRNIIKKDGNCLNFWGGLSYEDRKTLRHNDVVDLLLNNPHVNPETVTSIIFYQCINIGDETLIFIADQCRNLEYLSVSWCKNTTSAGIEAIAKNCVQLQRLYAYNCSISEIPENFGNWLPHLKSLDVSNNQMKSLVPPPPLIAQLAGTCKEYFKIGGSENQPLQAPSISKGLDTATCTDFYNKMKRLVPSPLITQLVGTCKEYFKIEDSENQPSIPACETTSKGLDTTTEDSLGLDTIEEFGEPSTPAYHDMTSKGLDTARTIEERGAGDHTPTPAPLQQPPVYEMMSSKGSDAVGRHFEEHDMGHQVPTSQIGTSTFLTKTTSIPRTETTRTCSTLSLEPLQIDSKKLDDMFATTKLGLIKNHQTRPSTRRGNLTLMKGSFAGSDVLPYIVLPDTKSKHKNLGDFKANQIEGRGIHTRRMEYNDDFLNVKIELANTEELLSPSCGSTVS